MPIQPIQPTHKPHCVALVPAAGSGSRFGATKPKQLSTLLGQPMIVHSLQTLLGHPDIAAVYVVLAPEDQQIAAVLPRHERLRVLNCGGASRQESVCNGLQAMADEPDHTWVLVHDAARPGLTGAMLDRLIAVCADHPVGGLLAMPVSDTLKRACQADTRNGSQTPAVSETVSRQGLWAAQTPQMFRREDLLKALRAAATRQIEVTDEASAMESVGKQPLLVMGSLRNWKVTYATDLRMVETLMQLDL